MTDGRLSESNRMILFCKACQTAHAIRRDVPDFCPTCHEPAQWVTMASEDEPRTIYPFTVQDKRFLRAGHIDPDR